MPKHQRASRSLSERSRNKYAFSQLRKHYRHKHSRSSTRRHRKNKRNYRDERKNHLHRRSRSSSFSSSSSSSSSSDSSRSQSNSSSDSSHDKIAHFKYQKGERLNHRYKVIKLLGDGTFGRVVKCEYKGKNYAVKIIKPVERYIESAHTERSIIKKINRKDKQDKWGIVRYVESFYCYRHFCLVFKPLGKSLYEFIKMNKYRGFSLRMLQSFFRQILRSIGFLHRIGYTHTDLKPENILLESQNYYEAAEERQEGKQRYYVPQSTKIRIIDFGGATRYDEYHSTVINTRQYRSPEVILQCMKWNEISDVWSIGCIICELYTGELFFPTHSDEEHIAMIEKNCGKYPSWMVQKIASDLPIKTMFKHGYIIQDRVENIENVIKLKTLQQIFAGHEILVDLLQKCLEIDPTRRISCAEAIKHPFFDLDL